MSYRELTPYLNKHAEMYPDSSFNRETQPKGFVMHQDGKRYLFDQEEGFKIFQVIPKSELINGVPIPTFGQKINQWHMSRDEAWFFLNEVGEYLKVASEEDQQTLEHWLEIAQEDFNRRYPEETQQS